MNTHSPRRPWKKSEIDRKQGKISADVCAFWQNSGGIHAFPVASRKEKEGTVKRSLKTGSKQKKGE